MHVKFRIAKRPDLLFLINLEKKAFNSFQQNTKASLKNSIDSTFQEIFIVENKDEIALGAFILFKYKYSIRIYSIAVLPEYENRGIGNSIIEFIIKFALERGFVNIILEADFENEKLINWYLNKGFKVIKKIPDYYCDGKDAVKMNLNLKKVLLK